MNTPNYIQRSNNQTSVLLRPMYEQMGFAARHFPGWITPRVQKLNLVEGKDFQTYVQDRHTQYVVPVAVALSILSTVSETKAAPIKKELSEVITGDNPTEAQNTPVEEPKEVLPVSPPLEVIKPATVPVIALNIAVPVYQIEGRAAVDGAGLYKLWNGPDERRLSGWLNYRIDKLGLVLGKHYVEYALPPSPGHRRGFMGYILSLDAAISIADSETKGKVNMPPQIEP